MPYLYYPFDYFIFHLGYNKYIDPYMKESLYQISERPKITNLRPISAKSQFIDHEKDRKKDSLKIWKTEYS